MDGGAIAASLSGNATVSGEIAPPYLFLVGGLATPANVFYVPGRLGETVPATHSPGSQDAAGALF